MANTVHLIYNEPCNSILCIEFVQDSNEIFWLDHFLGCKVYDSHVRISPTEQVLEEVFFIVLWVELCELVAFDFP